MDDAANAGDFEWVWVLGCWEDMLHRLSSFERSRRLELGSQSTNILDCRVASFLVDAIFQLDVDDRPEILHVGDLETPLGEMDEVISLLSEFLEHNKHYLNEIRFGSSDNINVWAGAFQNQRAWPANLKEACFSNVTLQGETTVQFLQTMLRDETFRKISFHSCQVDNVMFQSVLETLRGCKQIEFVGFNRQNREISREGQNRELTSFVLESLSTTQSKLRQIHFREQGLDAGFLPKLRTMVINSRHLQSLDLSWNHIFSNAPDNDMNQFLSAFQSHQSVKSLKLVGCGISNGIAARLFGSFTEGKCQSLSELKLAENPLTGEGSWVGTIPSSCLCSISLPHISQIATLGPLYDALRRSMSIELCEFYFEYTPSNIVHYLRRNVLCKRVSRLQLDMSALWPYILSKLDTARDGSATFLFLQKHLVQL